MLGWLWIIPALPFAGALVLALFGARLPRRVSGAIGAGSVGLSAVAAGLVALNFIGSGSAGGLSYTQTLWTWLNIAGFRPSISLYLDALSLVMVLVITFVSFLIHLYSTEFMTGDENYSRFFAEMNLFVGSMLTLVLAGNFLLLYLGWEGVGLCSYLLIGFWYREPQNGYAARKAFVVTRIGDTALAIALFLLFTHLGTLNIQEVMARAAGAWPMGSALATLTALLILGGAVGKSAQLPLQTWLPDAMAGPTPVSALIHAATMVTAGVYLIARTHVLFTLAPAALNAVAVIGAATLLLAGFSALVQHDIKRVLAYSTISQIGYMFLALGVGAWPAALFHFMIHAFFKALLFLGAGCVIQAMDEEHDMFKMGGLRKEMPLVFWTFLIASCSLAAVPLVTAGFYSKDMIIWQAYSSTLGSVWLWAAAIFGALLTSLYTFRMVILTFLGPLLRKAIKLPGWRMNVPLVVLAVLSIAGGLVNIPKNLGGIPALTQFLTRALPSFVAAPGRAVHAGLFEIFSGCVSLGGILLIELFMRSGFYQKITESPPAKALHAFLFSGWEFDSLYDLVFAHPYAWLARINRKDIIDYFYTGIGWLSIRAWRGLIATENGRVASFVLAIALGAAIIIGLAVFL
ncbi:MAG: NADH-quinone oxidoreductase subunit L [Syntrophobacteraceae bacterium]|nr:NADH-quinone oxidoreductase subunit L [Syntrophobacteraceae bacterium]